MKDNFIDSNCQCIACITERHCTALANMTDKYNKAVQLVNEAVDIVRNYDPDRYTKRIEWQKSWLSRASELH